MYSWQEGKARMSAIVLLYLIYGTVMIREAADNIETGISVGGCVNNTI